MTGRDEKGLLEQLLAQAGIRGLSEPDLTFLREALRRLQQPLPLPPGFESTAPVSVALPARSLARIDG